MSRFSTLLIAISLLAATAWAAEEHKTAGTVAVSANWATTSVANLNTANDVRGTHSNADGIDSIYLTNFGFTIPAGATIDSVFVGTQGLGSASQAPRRAIHTHLTTDAVTPVGEEPGGIAQGTGDTDNETIGPTTPTWNYTLTADSINLTNFGTIIHNSVTQAGTVEIDSVSIRVVYTEAAGGPGPQMIIIGN